MKSIPTLLTLLTFLITTSAISQDYDSYDYEQDVQEEMYSEDANLNSQFAPLEPQGYEYAPGELERQEDTYYPEGVENDWQTDEVYQ